MPTIIEDVVANNVIVCICCFRRAHFRVSFACKIERNPDGKSRQWRVNGIKLVCVMVNELYAGRYVARFIEKLRIAPICGDDTNCRDDDESSSENRVDPGLQVRFLRQK